MATASIGSGWEGRVVDGNFPLLEWLDGSGNCASFLTVLPGAHQAVIQLILTSGAEADAYLAQWNYAKTLHHPHLVRVVSAGRCVIDGSDLVYVVTERFHKTLAKNIQLRALDVDAAREVFIPVLKALGYLHKHEVVHGHVNPSNILLANAKPKLSGKDLLIAGAATRVVAQSGNYDAPELSNGEVTAAADTWSVGVTMWEALTQTLPVWDSSGKVEPANAASLPQPFREIVLDCLRVDPLQRPTVQTVLERLEASGTVAPSDSAVPVKSDSNRAPAPMPTKEAVVADEQPRVPPEVEKIEAEESTEPAPFSRPLKSLEQTHSNRFWSTLLVLILLAGIAFVSFHFVREYLTEQAVTGPSLNAPAVSEQVPKEQSPAAAPPVPSPAEPETSPVPNPQPPATQETETKAAAPVSQPAPPPPSPVARAMDRENANGLVAKRVLPAVSAAASHAMRRPIEVELRVSVNRRGKVSDVTYESLGPGNYFARIAERAAWSWEFTPPIRNGHPEPSFWILRFKFTRETTEATAIEDRE